MKKLIVAKGLIKIMICLSIAFMINLFQVNNKAIAQKVSVSIHVPLWAPHYQYTEKVRYYYMPDIESYYDLNRQQFVYFQNGVWVYTTGLPPAYATYDMDNAYVVVLDYNVYNPWRYHNTYRSHYPRYYYRTVYKTTVINNTTIRGFNENEKNVVYSQPHNKGNAVKNNNAANNSKQTQEKPEQRKEVKPYYHDNTVGHPVQAKHNEKKPEQQKSPGHSNDQQKGNGKRK